MQWALEFLHLHDYLHVNKKHLVPAQKYPSCRMTEKCFFLCIRNKKCKVMNSWNGPERDEGNQAVGSEQWETTYTQSCTVRLSHGERSVQLFSWFMARKDSPLCGHLDEPGRAPMGVIYVWWIHSQDLLTTAAAPSTEGCCNHNPSIAASIEAAENRKSVGMQGHLKSNFRAFVHFLSLEALNNYVSAF